MNKVISQELLSKVLDCIVRAIHPNYSHLDVNILMKEIATLPDEDKLSEDEKTINELNKLQDVKGKADDKEQ